MSRAKSVLSVPTKFMHLVKQLHQLNSSYISLQTSVSGNSMTQTSEEAFSKQRFEPFEFCGQPVADEFFLTLLFEQIYRPISVDFQRTGPMVVDGEEFFRYEPT